MRLPQVIPHLHLVGHHPSHAFFTTRPPCPQPHGNASLLGTNVTILGQNYKYSSWHHFYYSQVIWRSSFACQRSLKAQVIMYCQSGSQRGRVPTQVWAGRPGTEGVVGGAEPSRTKMRSSLGPCSRELIIDGLVICFFIMDTLQVDKFIFWGIFQDPMGKFNLQYNFIL